MDFGAIARVRDAMMVCISSLSQASINRDSELGMKLPKQNYWPLVSVGLNPARICSPFLTQSGTAATTMGHDSTHESEFSEILHVELSSLMECVYWTCVHQSCLALCDPFVSLDRLQRPFGLFLGLMSRGRLASHFLIAMQSQNSGKELKDWEELPFVSLGGAGSHYPLALSQVHGNNQAFRSYRQRISKEILSGILCGHHSDFGDDWFDMQDLEGFLRARNIRFFVCSEGAKNALVVNMFNVMHFIPGKST